MKSYDMDFRRKVLDEAINTKESMQAIALKFQINPTTVKRWIEAGKKAKLKEIQPRLFSDADLSPKLKATIDDQRKIIIGLREEVNQLNNELKKKTRVCAALMETISEYAKRMLS